MTLKYFCDRCGKLSDKTIFGMIIRGPKSQTKYGYDKNVDICLKCYKDFQNFMKRKIRKNENL